jgi:hypothetical protein
MYKTPADIVLAVRNRACPNLTRPTHPVKRPNQSDPEFTLDVFDYQEDHKPMNERIKIYDAHESNKWALFFDQCSPSLKTLLKGAPDFQTARASNDVIGLISLIQGYCCQFDHQGHPHMSIAEAFKSLCLAFQQPTQSNNNYFNDFKSLVKVLETYSGSGALGFLPEMIKVELEDICTTANTTVALATDEQKPLARNFSRH